MCVWCPLWPVQRLLSVQPRFKGCPLILLTESRRHLSVAAYSPEAVPYGVHVGMSLGEARSLWPIGSSRHLGRPLQKPIFRRTDPLADRTRLQALALHCQRYSPLVGLEDTVAPDSLWLDISGSEALFGGEEGLIHALRTDLAEQGIQVRIAIANTWGAAWAVSHFAESVISIIPSTEEQEDAIKSLPVAALRLPDKIVDSLRTLDILTIGQLMRLPRASLPSRFGKELGRRLDQALGLVPELLTAERSLEPLIVEWLFEEPMTDRQAVNHVCEVLLERLLTTLDDRRVGLRELICHWLGAETEPFSLRLLRPTTERRHLLGLLRLQCERHVFASGIHGVRIEVVEMGLPLVRQATLFGDDTQDKQPQAFAELVERLSSHLGYQAVLRAHLQPDPLPEFSCQYVPCLNSPTVVGGAPMILSRLRCRPLRLLRVPRLLSVETSSREVLPSRIERLPVIRVSGPERIESGWWRGADAKRDYYRFDLSDGASLWTFCDRVSGHWFLHGLFS